MAYQAAKLSTLCSQALHTKIAVKTGATAHRCLVARGRVATQNESVLAQSLLAVSHRSW